MISEFFVQSESILTYFYIIATVVFTYKETSSLSHKWINLLVFTSLFSIVFKPIELLYNSYILYILFTILFSLLFCLVYFRGQLMLSIATSFYLMYSVVAIKGALTSTLLFFMPVSSSNHFFTCLRGILLFLSFIFFSFFFQKHPIRPAQKLPVQYWITFLFAMLMPVLGLEWFGRNYRTFESHFVVIPNLFLCLSLFSTYYLSYIIIRLYEEKLQTSFINQKLALQSEYIQQNSNMITQVRKERHELKNQYFYIETLVKAQKYEELQTFLTDEMQQHFELMEEFHTGNTLVDYILTSKVNEARAAGIHIMTDAILPSTLPISENDLCALLLNLLDNAIDASKKELHGDIQIHIGIVKQYLSIKIRNKSSIDVLSSNPELQTIKSAPEYHGFGMQIIRSIVKKYNGIFDTYMAAGYFNVSALLWIPSK